MAAIRATSSKRAVVGGQPAANFDRRVGPAAAGARLADVIVKTSHAEIAVKQSSGTRLPVLLLHGNSSCKEAFVRQFESPLGQEYRLIAIDLPGHGASSDAFDPGRTYSLPGLAETAIEVVENLGLDELVVVGSSLGGHVGLEMMAVYPDLLGLMIVGAPPVRCSRNAVIEGFRAHPALALASKLSLSEEDIDSFALRTGEDALDVLLRAAARRADGRARQMTIASLFAGNASDERELVEILPIPLAVVNGAEDPFVNTDYLQTLPYANLWDRKCHLIPRVGHAPFLEAPQIFNHLLARFLRRMEAAARHRARHPALAYSG